MTELLRNLPWKPLSFVVVMTALLLLAGGCAEETPVAPGGNLLRPPGPREATGYSIDIEVERRTWQDVRLQVIHALPPSFSRDASRNYRSDMRVEPRTQGKLVAIITTSEGETAEVLKQVEVDNLSRAMFYRGQAVTSLGQIFLPAEIPSTARAIKFYCFFDQPLTLQSNPTLSAVAFHSLLRFSDIVAGAAVPARGAKAVIYKTDSGRTITTTEDPWPGDPDLDSATVDSLLRDLGLLDSVTKVGPPSDSTNCWGWTFTCGSTWISDSADVRKILEDNGYTQVTTPQPGDVAVYKDSNGAITHTGIVRSDGNGGIKVESKWGAWGRYCHSPTAVPPSYGTVCYFRTSRPAPPGSMDPDKEKHTVKTS